MAPPRVTKGKVTLLESFLPLSKPIQRESRTDARSVPCLGGMGVVGEGNGKINLEEKKEDFVAVTEGDGWRQSQIQAERKLKISEEKENSNRNVK